MTVAKLREEVCSAVEVEIHNQVTEFEITDEEHIEISHAAWARFYSCAIQYHEAGMKPMGLVVDGDSGLFAVVKRSGHSFIRPIDPLEQLVLTQGIGINGPELFHETPLLGDDPSLAHDVVNLIRAITMVSGLVTPSLADEFRSGLQKLISPDQVARDIANCILSSDSEDVQTFADIQQELNTSLSQVQDLAKSLEVLLVSLELDGGIVARTDVDLLAEEAEFNSLQQLFSSNTGVSVLSESLKQMANVRFNLTRDVILLQMIMLQCGYLDRVPKSVPKLIQSTFLPRSVVMAHCYFVLVWLTETLSSTPPPNSL